MILEGLPIKPDKMKGNQWIVTSEYTINLAIVAGVTGRDDAFPVGWHMATWVGYRVGIRAP